MVECMGFRVQRRAFSSPTALSKLWSVISGKRLNLSELGVPLLKHKDDSRSNTSVPAYRRRLIHSEAAGTSLVVQWLRLHALNAGGRVLIPGQDTRSHMP